MAYADVGRFPRLRKVQVWLAEAWDWEKVRLVLERPLQLCLKLAVAQNRGPVLVGVGEFTTHVRTDFSGWIESDVHWGLTDFDPWPVLDRFAGNRLEWTTLSQVMSTGSPRKNRRSPVVLLECGLKGKYQGMAT